MSQDLTREHRWPGWTAWAVDHGVRGVLAAPIDLDDQVVGALGLYSRDSNRFGPDVELTSMLVAEQAGLLVAGVVDPGEDRDAASTPAGHAASAPDHADDSDIVNRAVCLITEQRGCRPQHGLDALQQAAASLGLPITTLAEHLVETADSRRPPGRRIPRTRSSDGQ